MHSFYTYEMRSKRMNVMLCAECCMKMKYEFYIKLKYPHQLYRMTGCTQAFRPSIFPLNHKLKYTLKTRWLGFVSAIVMLTQYRLVSY